MSYLAAEVLELFVAFGSAFPAERANVTNWIRNYKRHAAATMAERIGDA